MRTDWSAERHDPDSRAVALIPEVREAVHVDAAGDKEHGELPKHDVPLGDGGAAHRGPASLTRSDPADAKNSALAASPLDKICVTQHDMNGCCRLLQKRQVEAGRVCRPASEGNGASFAREALRDQERTIRMVLWQGAANCSNVFLAKAREALRDEVASGF